MNARRHRLSKPPLGAAIDWSHPSARGLVAFVPVEVSGWRIADVVAGIPLNLIGGATFNGDAEGLVLACNQPGAGASGTIPAVSPALIVPPFTLGVALTWDGMAPEGSPDTPLWGTSTSAAPTASVAYRFSIGYDGTDTVLYVSTYGQPLTVDYPIAAGARIVAFGAVDADSGTLTVFAPDGTIWTATSALTPTIVTYTPTAQLHLGTQSGFTPRTAHCSLSWGMIHDRVLDPQEMTALAANPWQLFRRAGRRAPGLTFRRTLSHRAGSRTAG